jgi:site-specific DNA recombinase
MSKVFCKPVSHPLESQKSILIKSFPLATNQDVRNGIEEEITKIQKEIQRAKNKRNRMELEEMGVMNFIKWCKNLMEHPSKIIEDIRSEQELMSIFSLFFEEFPTYSQIVSGTPKLSLVFKLSEEFYKSNSVCVT